MPDYPHIPKMQIFIKTVTIPMPFLSLRISPTAQYILAMASSLRTTSGGILYKMFTHKELARQLFVDTQKLSRAKRELRDKNLLDFKGNPGDYSECVKYWESVTGDKWVYPL